MRDTEQWLHLVVKFVRLSSALRSELCDIRWSEEEMVRAVGRWSKPDPSGLSFSSSETKFYQHIQHGMTIRG